MEQLELSDRTVAEAARRYVHAYLEACDAFGPGMLTAAIEYDGAQHALVVAVNGTCAFCAPGTCPLCIDVRPVADTRPL